MADSLDDFFAKKDKKRGKDKTKPSALSAEALVRELEEGAKQSDYPIRNKPSAAIEILGLDSNDADWKDFEEVERRDYTGLKVKEMSIQDQNDDEQRQPEPVPESTPWKMKDDNSSAKASAAATAAAAEVSKQSQETDNPSKASTTDPIKSASATTTSTTTTTTTTPGSTTTSDTNRSVSDNASTDLKDGGEVENSEKSEAQSKQTLNEGDSEKSSAKKEKYVPPAQRGAGGEVKVLEPMLLSKVRPSNSKLGKDLNIQDTNAFPSLG